MYVLLDFFFVKRAPAGPLEAHGAQIQGPSWGPYGPWGPDTRLQLGPFRSLGPGSGPQLGPKGPWGPDSMEWGPNRKKNTFFFPLKLGPAGALIGYRENQCVFSERIQYILEKDVKTNLSGKSMHF